MTDKKIIIANRRYFQSSGPERYFFNISSMLEQDCFDVIPFTVKRKWNKSSLYSDYFVDAPYSEDVLFYEDASLSFSQKTAIFFNCIYSFEARRKITKLITDHNIQLAYLLGIVNDISPSVIDGCKKKGIPVILRLSDYNLMCGNYHFLRSKQVCQLCIEKSPMQCTVYRCVKNQFFPSFARTISMIAHNLLHVYDYVSAFVCPSQFMRDAMIKAGFPDYKLHHINTFIPYSEYSPCYENDGYSLYFGRVSDIKGIEYLIDAHRMIKRRGPLLIVGDYNNKNYFLSLQQRIAEHNIDDISFLGFKTGDELKDIISRARFVVAPSICPDNSPNTVLEAFACGKPVIGTAIGGIKEQITPECGFIVPPKDSSALAEKMTVLWNDDNAVVSMGKRARQRVETVYSPEVHYTKLRSLIDQCLL